MNNIEGPRSYLKYTTLGFQIVGFMAIFGFLGRCADDYFAYDKPVFLIFGLLFGVIAAMVFLIRTLTKSK